ncbi:FAD-dependent oxidoreductase [Gordonia sinesedis]
MHGVVIAGAGLGAVRVAEKLRANGFDAPITVIGAEPHPPYDRPPLSKTVLQGKDDRVDLKPADFYRDTAIDLRLSQRVTAVSTAAKTVSVTGVGDGGATPGETVGYDTLVLATGLVPRPFPGVEPLTGLHTLRTFDDAESLRAEIDHARTGVVVGAGFIGCEVAASLTSRGVRVTLVEPADTPLAAALGPQIGGMVADMHIGRGVDVRTGTGVASIDGADRAVRAVRLTDGTEVPADLVVVGIGSRPVVDYLDGSGIALAPPEDGGGVACDASGAASAPGVYAVGDVANWADADGRHRRVEHWNHVVDQASIVASAIGGGAPPAPTVPYFWSDQFDLKIQVLGDPRPTDDVHLVTRDGEKFVAYFSRDGVLTAVAGAGKAGAVLKLRPKLLARTPIGDLL